MKNYGRLTGWLIGGWFIFALAGSALNVFRNDSERVGVAVAIAALAPIVVFAAWFAASEEFRKFALSLNPKLLTSLQTWRNCRLHLRTAGGSRSTPGDFCAAGGIRGHDDRRYSSVRCVAAW